MPLLMHLDFWLRNFSRFCWSWIFENFYFIVFQICKYVDFMICHLQPELLLHPNLPSLNSEIQCLCWCSIISGNAETPIKWFLSLLFYKHIDFFRCGDQFERLPMALKRLAYRWTWNHQYWLQPSVQFLPVYSVTFLTVYQYVPVHTC